MLSMTETFCTVHQYIPRGVLIPVWVSYLRVSKQAEYEINPLPDDKILDRSNSKV